MPDRDVKAVRDAVRRKSPSRVSKRSGPRRGVRGKAAWLPGLVARSRRWARLHPLVMVAMAVIVVRWLDEVVVRVDLYDWIAARTGFYTTVVAALAYTPRGLIMVAASLMALRMLRGGSWRVVLKRIGLLSWDRRQMLAAFVTSACILAVETSSWVVGKYEIRMDRPWIYAVVRAMNLLGYIVIHEEVVYRGFIFGIIRRHASFLVAAVLSAFLWGSWHFAPGMWQSVREGHWVLPAMHVLGPFLAGIPLAWMVERGRGSLWGPILVHTAVNVGMACGYLHPSAASPAWTRYAWLEGGLIYPAIVALVSFAMLRPKAKRRE